MSHLYPVYLRLEGQKCVVVGGGQVAARKVASLLECGAAVTVISPHVTPELADLSRRQLITYHQRPYRSGDLDGAFLVISATDDEQVNQQVAHDAQTQKILVNVVDDPTYCSFYVPSVIRRGSLCISISTEGKSPLLARKLREELAARFGPEYGILVDILGEARVEVLERIADPAQRRYIFNQLVELDLITLIKEGKVDLVKERVAQCLSSLSD
ncbi:MAG: bifunctional precorrin-2 dehydrogenase/sirohydrochlorin ferrochelatase [Firmicutes bacterium]|nr:bifunctional precorrin-2 dehydrogenase/sirohydrochlorin ferrochelatase [Bacillota bacterium]